jgi:hypothetical protein
MTDLESYVASPGYPYDLAATRRIWSEPAVAGISGIYIFLLYLSVPVLLDVRSGRGSPARSALDGERERAFLMNITGCTEHDSWGGGIRNRRVQRQASLLGRCHAGFSGMKREYLDFIGAVVTLAPLEVRAELRTPVDAGLRCGYWRYMSHAISLLNADIGDEPSAWDRCRDFVDAYGAPSSEGRRLYASLQSRHPWYVDRAVPILPGRAQSVVSTLKKDATC